MVLGGAWESVSKELQGNADTAGHRPPFNWQGYEAQGQQRCANGTSITKESFLIL